MPPCASPSRTAPSTRRCRTTASTSAFGENAAFNPSTLWSVGYDQIMHEEVQAALLGQKTPEQALADAQARLMDIASFP